MPFRRGRSWAQRMANTDILQERAGHEPAADRPTGISVPGNKGIKVMKACTIMKPAAELDPAA